MSWGIVHYGMGDRKRTCPCCGSARTFLGEPGSRYREHAWMAYHLFHCSGPAS